MKDTLINTLEQVGKPVTPYHSPDGSVILILPYGGRVLGLFAPGSDENFLWTHPSLESKETASAFYESDQWHNSGGDRTWLAPEVDLFFPDFPSTDRYWQPRQLDPGEFEVINEKGQPRLVNQLTVVLKRSNSPLELQMTKGVASAPNPLRYEHGTIDWNRLEYAGYTLRTTLEIQTGRASPTPQVGLWNLLQMPHEGQLLAPLHFATQPKVFFGDISPEDLIVNARGLHYCMRASGGHKIGIRAVATTGRIGYLYPTPGGRWALVVRNFFVNPSGDYIDVPWDDTEDCGFAVQACNISNELGRFSELEYHVPAIGPDPDRSQCVDISQIWAFRGAEEDVRSVAAMLLGMEPDMDG